MAVTFMKTSGGLILFDIENVSLKFIVEKFSALLIFVAAGI